MKGSYSDKSLSFSLTLSCPGKNLVVFYFFKVIFYSFLEINLLIKSFLSDLLYGHEMVNLLLKVFLCLDKLAPSEEIGPKKGKSQISK